ncbi:hypothetical protein ACLOJK_003771 [Asimina triloba]
MLLMSSGSWKQSVTIDFAEVCRRRHHVTDGCLMHVATAGEKEERGADSVDSTAGGFGFGMLWLAGRTIGRWVAPDFFCYQSLISNDHGYWSEVVERLPNMELFADQIHEEDGFMPPISRSITANLNGKEAALLIVGKEETLAIAEEICRSIWERHRHWSDGLDVTGDDRR